MAGDPDPADVLRPEALILSGTGLHPLHLHPGERISLGTDTYKTVLRPADPPGVPSQMNLRFCKQNGFPRQNHAVVLHPAIQCASAF